MLAGGSRKGGHLLTEGHAVPQPELPDGLRQVLQFQQHLLGLLDPRGPAATASGGEQATPGEYFTDLRILACLITASWPAARDLATLPGQAGLISQHAAAARRQASATAEERAQRRQIAYYDTPPLEAATCAALLTLADDILASTSPRSLSQAVRHLTDPVIPAFQRWVILSLPPGAFTSGKCLDLSPLKLALLDPEISAPGLRPWLPRPPPEWHADACGPQQGA